MLDTIIDTINKIYYRHKVYIIICGIILLAMLFFYLVDDSYFTSLRKILSGGFDTTAYAYPQKRTKRDSRKTEKICRSILEDITGLSFPSRRPDFLRNPETNKNLECDMLNHDIKLCVELQGRQHYKKDDHWHKGDEAKYESQRKRDMLKKKLLENNGYNLLEVPYTVHPDEFGKFLCRNLPNYTYNSRCQRYMNMGLYD